MKTIDRRLKTPDRRTVRPREKTADQIYRGSHVDWARAVKERAGWKCEVPGCGSKGVLYADHIVEIEDGGDPRDLNNGQCLCAKHHAEKTARSRGERAAQSLKRNA